MHMKFPQERVKTSAVDTEAVAAGVTQSVTRMEIAAPTSTTIARGKTTVRIHQARVPRQSLTPPTWLLLQLQLAATVPTTSRVSQN